MSKPLTVKDLLDILNELDQDLGWPGNKIVRKIIRIVKEKFGD